MNGTSWLLGGGYPWLAARSFAPAGTPPSVVGDPELGLSLAAVPDGPLGLAAADGSLGRLTLPMGVAVARGRLFILSADGSRIYVWDGERQALCAIPEIGMAGVPADAGPSVSLEPRRFSGAVNIAALGRLLYVADAAAHRVQVFDWPTGALVRIHGGFAGPTDVAAGRHGVYVLDAERGRVLCATAHGSMPVLVAEVAPRRGRWTRLAVDRDERLYLRRDEPADPVCGTPARTVLDVVVPVPCGVARTVSETVTDAAAVRSRFDAPPVWSEWNTPGTRWTFAMRDRLADPCGLRAPLRKTQVAIRVGDQRWVLDRERRVAELRDLEGRRVRRFGPLNANGEPTTGRAAGAWLPTDVVAYDGCTLILDVQAQAVYAYEPGAPALRRWFARAFDPSQPRTGLDDWRRIAIDDAGVLLLWNGTGDRAGIVDRVDVRGRKVGTCTVREAARWLAPRTDDTPAPRPAADLRLGRDGGISWAQDGGLPDLRRVYERAGTWISAWLDSDIYRCQWHLVELAIRELPPGSRITVRTRTSDERPPAGAEPAGVLSGSWSDPLTITAPAQPTPAELARARSRDLLVQSGPGQYLQLLIELAGDGIATPVIGRVRLRFPYESLRQFLPAVYASPDEQRQFLDRFLGVVQRTWDDVERTVTGFERFLDPRSVPGGVPMRWLASWLGVRLEGTWTDAQNRRLFSAMRDALPRWGTPAGLRGWIAVYLANLSGHEPEDVVRSDLPVIVEGFTERRRLTLGHGTTARLGAADPLWGPEVERRLQVGVFDREGSVEIVSVGDPAVDVFRHSAHRFRVCVPSAWVRTASDESILRRAIAVQAPAHASWELVLIEPRFRVGAQSTIGLDTVIGAPVVSGLACPTDTEPPSRPPRERLGFDLVLGAGLDDAALGGADLILA